ncbi:hypothetical protein KSS87_015809, partial [Heliosperma pusillum]
MEEKILMKRKRVQTQLTPEEKESRLKTLNDELNSLFNYFNEVLNSDITSSLSLFKDNVNLNAAIAALLEEKRCSCSKLVNEIYDKVKDRDGNGVTVTVSSVKASVLYVGQRISYGVANGEVDTRDMKLLPSSLRGTLKIRRICRKKISERITAVQDVITSLEKYEDNLSCKHGMTKATEKLKKILSEADIRMLMESLSQKNDTEMAEKEAKKTGTSLVKELEKNKLKAEKEKKRMDRELQKEKLQSEKERKRMQLEAEKEEKRREKEDYETRKHLKRKQEEADKEQRQKEKEEAELKKRLAVQKQASIMDRFLKKSKTTSTSQNDQSTGVATSVSNVDKRENTFESVSMMMDSALQHTNDIDVQEIRNCHMNSWRLVGHSIRSNKHHWGTRRTPKTQLIKELKLTTNNEPTGDDDFCVDGLVDRQGEMCGDGKSCHDHSSVSSQGTRKCLRRKQLLQFDKSNRPAFYGIWPKKSHVIGFRHPFKKDPDLDYEIDSDEEWEEEEPGESLSDSEKEDEEILDEGSCKGDDEEESEDGFFVPDGYLSESEVH